MRRNAKYKQRAVYMTGSTWSTQWINGVENVKLIELPGFFAEVITGPDGVSG